VITGFAPKLHAAVPAQLLAALLVGKWQVALQVHRVVQDTPDFDDPTRRYPVQEKVTSAPTMSRDVQSAEARHDLVHERRLNRASASSQ
jgi:hypothetical protein